MGRNPIIIKDWKWSAEVVLALAEDWQGNKTKSKTRRFASSHAKTFSDLHFPFLRISYPVYFCILNISLHFSFGRHQFSMQFCLMMKRKDVSSSIKGLNGAFADMKLHTRRVSRLLIYFTVYQAKSFSFRMNYLFSFLSFHKNFHSIPEDFVF